MKKPGPRRQLVLQSLSTRATTGMLVLGSLRLHCALGRSGQKAQKREGDGATPRGKFRVRQVYYRPDRVQRPSTRLPVRQLRPSDGWCDQAGDRNYNRHVRHPYPANAETMWRQDALYDIVVVLTYNERPRVQGRGSAIFMHVARNGLRPTEGCLALALPDLRRLLSLLDGHATVRIGR